MGVLDVGSNTVHLLVVDARRGGHPTPMSSTKASLRLAEAIDSSGKLTRKGADKLVGTIDEFAKIATSSGCAELMAFATSAVRDAKNSEDVLARVLAETGVALKVLTGVDELDVALRLRAATPLLLRQLPSRIHVVRQVGA